MNALLLFGAIFTSVGALVLVVAHVFRRGATLEQTVRLLKIGAALLLVGAGLTLAFVIADAITEMPQLRQ